MKHQSSKEEILKRMNEKRFNKLIVNKNKNKINNNSNINNKNN